MLGGRMAVLRGRTHEPCALLNGPARQTPQLAYGGASGVEPSEISRMVHSLDTTSEGLIDYQEKASFLFSGRQHAGAEGPGRTEWLRLERLRLRSGVSRCSCCFLSLELHASTAKFLSFGAGLICHAQTPPVDKQCMLFGKDRLDE